MQVYAVFIYMYMACRSANKTWVAEKGLAALEKLRM